MALNLMDDLRALLVKEQMYLEYRQIYTPDCPERGAMLVPFVVKGVPELGVTGVPVFACVMLVVDDVNLADVGDVTLASLQMKGS